MIPQTEEEAIDIIIKAHDLGEIADDRIEKALNKSKLVKRTTIDKNGRKQTKWVRVDKNKPSEKKNKKQKPENSKEKKSHSDEQLSSFAKEAGTDKLHNAIKTHGDEKIRIAAQKELKRRESEETGEEKPKGAKKPGQLGDKVKSKIKDWHKKQQDFYNHGHHEPHSEARKSMGDLIKKKGKGILTGIQHEIHEWKEAGIGIGKVFSGKASELTSHEKKAMKTVAIHLAITVGGIIATGGISSIVESGAAAFGKHVALHYLEHAGITRLGHALLFAKAEEDALKSGMSPEAALKKLIKNLSDYIEHGNISDEDWAMIGDAANKDSTIVYGDEDEEEENGEDKEPEKKPEIKKSFFPTLLQSLKNLLIRKERPEDVAIKDYEGDLFALNVNIQKSIVQDLYNKLDKLHIRYSENELNFKEQLLEVEGNIKKGFDLSQNKQYIQKRFDRFFESHLNEISQITLDIKKAENNLLFAVKQSGTTIAEKSEFLVIERTGGKFYITHK